MHVEDGLIDNGIMETSVPHEEPSDSLQEYYIKRSEVEKVMNDKIKTAVDVTTRRIFTGIVQETNLAYETVESSTETDVTAVRLKESEDRCLQIERHRKGATESNEKKVYDR